MSQQPLYGYPCVTDPHDFIPDNECCSPQEVEAHRLACANYGKPTYEPNKGCITNVDADGKFVSHILRTSWGIGTNLILVCDECGESRDEALIECHDCYRDFCGHCWPKHATGDEL